MWMLPLPLAIPTYIAAYVYVDILDAAGPLQTALRGLFGWRAGGDYWFPPIRSLGGAVFVISEGRLASMMLKPEKNRMTAPSTI